MNTKKTYLGAFEVIEKILLILKYLYIKNNKYYLNKVFRSRKREIIT
tara:strand:- start:2513 stop:2653 length:141 start_codon:yes stop_codon:yes gene_type:complete